MRATVESPFDQIFTDVIATSIAVLGWSLVVCPKPMELVADAELIVWVSAFGRTSVLDLMPLFIVVLDAYCEEDTMLVIGPEVPTCWLEALLL